MYTRVHLYTIIKNTVGMAVYMCQCMLLAICALTAVCMYMLMLQSYGQLLYYCSCVMISLHPPSCNIAGCDTCLIVWHLLEDELFHAAKECHYLFVCLFVLLWVISDTNLWFIYSLTG